MFERFTSEAREVMVLALEEARELRHNYIGTEHILLGLLRIENGIASAVLPSFGITLDRVRRQVVQIVGTGEATGDGQIPFTPRAKKALDLGLREALGLGHTYLGDQHLLLGLLKEGDGVAIQVLNDFDVDPGKVREAVLAVPAPQRRDTETPAEVAARAERADFWELKALLHILERGGPTATILRDHGIDEAAIHKLLEDRG